MFADSAAVPASAAEVVRSAWGDYLKHTATPEVPDSGSYEVRFPDGRPSVFFYFDDNPGRASITRAMTS
jgi:hypothetical protein